VPGLPFGITLTRRLFLPYSGLEGAIVLGVRCENRQSASIGVTRVRHAKSQAVAAERLNDLIGSRRPITSSDESAAPIFDRVASPGIAGLPPAAGPYASILPLIVYAIFGSPRQLIVGPDVATLSILAASLSQVSTGSVEQRIAVAAALAIAVGLLCLLSAVFR